MLFPEDSVLRVSPFVRLTSPTIRDAAQGCIDSEMIALATACLHKAGDHCSEKLSQHRPDAALELLQKKEDLVSQLTPLPHSHVHFNPRDKN